MGCGSPRRARMTPREHDTRHGRRDRGGPRLWHHLWPRGVSAASPTGPGQAGGGCPVGQEVQPPQVKPVLVAVREALVEQAVGDGDSRDAGWRPTPDGSGSVERRDTRLGGLPCQPEASPPPSRDRPERHRASRSCRCRSGPASRSWAAPQPAPREREGPLAQLSAFGAGSSWSLNRRGADGKRTAVASSGPGGNCSSSLHPERGGPLQASPVRPGTPVELRERA